MYETCPNCSGKMRQGASAPAVTGWLFSQLIEDRGTLLVCGECGSSFVVWSRPLLIFKTLIAVFTAWLAVYLASIAFLVVSVLLGLPATFGFQERELDTDRVGPLLVGAGIAILGSGLAFYAFLPDVIRQWRLRWTLHRADS